MKILSINKNNLVLNILKYSFIFVFAFLLVFPPVVVNAEPCTGVDTPKGCSPPFKSEGSGTNPPFKSEGSGTTPDTKIITGLENPLGKANINELPDLITAILKFVLLVGIPIVTLAIIYAGFLFVTAAGNSEKLKKAKQTLLYTLIGAALLFGSFVIAKAIEGTVKEVGSGV